MLSAGLSRKTVVRSRLPPEPPLSSSSRTTCRGLVAFRFGGRAAAAAVSTPRLDSWSWPFRSASQRMHPNVECLHLLHPVGRSPDWAGPAGLALPLDSASPWQVCGSKQDSFQPERPFLGVRKLYAWR